MPKVQLKVCRTESGPHQSWLDHLTRFFFPRTTAKGRWPRGGVTGSGLSASGGRRLRGDAAHGTFVGFEFGSWRWGLAMKPWDWKKYHYIPQNVKTNLRWYILMRTAFPVTSHKQTLRNHGNGLGVKIPLETILCSV